MRGKIIVMQRSPFVEKIKFKSCPCTQSGDISNLNKNEISESAVMVMPKILFVRLASFIVTIEHIRIMMQRNCRIVKAARSFDSFLKFGIFSIFAYPILQRDSGRSCLILVHAVSGRVKEFCSCFFQKYYTPWEVLTYT